MSIVFQFLLVLVIADFISGLIHWLEDAYGREHFPITGRLITQPNILHHHNPRYFTRHSWWHSSWDLVCFCALIVIGARSLGCLTWHVWLFSILGANANQIHKWAHRTPQENGRVISFLQRCRLIQTPRHHAHHHTDPKSSHYCVLSDFLNPVLDRCGLWPFLERIIFKSLGIARRTDTSLSYHSAEFRGNETSSALEAVRVKTL